MKGELALVNKLYYNDKKCDFIPSVYDFGISLYIDGKNKLEIQLNNKELLTKGIDDIIDFFKQYGNEIDYDIKVYQKLRDNIDNFLDYVEYISISLECTNILKFINDNPILKNKKIVLPGIIEINDYEKIQELLEIYNEYKDNIYVSMSGNMGYISLTECLNTIKIIKEQAERILALSLSPMETIMYTYDRVRNRVYKDEDVSELAIESRNLNSVLKGEKIVCVGYSNIFLALLHYMGYKLYKAGMKYKDEEDYDGHERNVMYVKDDKYNIDGIYYFDVTWDSKTKGETNEFLNRYLFFAKTLKQMIEIEKDGFIYEQCPSYSDDMELKLKTILDNKDLSMINLSDILSINYMSRLVGGENLIDIPSIINPTVIIDEHDKKNY